MTPYEIAAHLQIQQTVYRYCRGVDRGDAELIASVYHDGAIDDHGAFRGPGKEFATWIVDAMKDLSTIGQHHITNISIELDGNTARVESYFLSYHPGRISDDGVEEGLSVGGGRYLDRFEERSGAWKIADRLVVIDFSRCTEAFVPSLLTMTAPWGKRGDEDPSSDLFRSPT